MSDLKKICIERIQKELKINPRISNNIVSFKIDKIDNTQIDLIHHLSCMCSNLKIKPSGNLKIAVILHF